MKPNRRSRTSDWVAAARALYTAMPGHLSTASDPVALDLLGPGLRGLLGMVAFAEPAAAAAHHVIGAATLGLSYTIPLRTAAIDDVLRTNASCGVKQLVVLGAGLDARAWRMPELADTAVFELDHPSTQNYKRSKIESRPLNARSVHFCPIDFERETIDSVLARAGYDARAPSTWIWEGVTMYLTNAAIDASLDSIARATTRGSRLALTYVPPDFGPDWMQRLGNRVSRLIGEELRGYMTSEDVANRLSIRGFRVELDESCVDWAARYWPGLEPWFVRPYERLAVARRLEKAS